jgi:Putative DNA-binding domain
MELPEDLTAWTFEAGLEVVRGHEFEPGRFDFKEVLTPKKGSNESRGAHAASVRRTACSMANTLGGYILFGIRDRKVTLELSDRIVSIPLAGDRQGTR